jgi:hypothetical protein
VPGGPEQLVEPTLLEVGAAQGEYVHRHRVVHQRQRLGVGVAQPFDPVDLRAERDAERLGDGVRGHPNLQQLDLGARCLTGLAQVVVEAGQLHRPAHLGMHDLGADATLAHQHAAFDQVADGAAHGRPGHPQPVGQLDLVLQPPAHRQLAVLDQLLQPAGHLEVERDRAAPVQREVRYQPPDRRPFRHCGPLCPDKVCKDKVLTC